MEKMFNVNGVCIPGLHYMVDLKDRLDAIKAMVDAGQYFAINKARQYGKTTTLRALAGYLKDDYIVISLDFQRMSSARFCIGIRLCEWSGARDFKKSAAHGTRVRAGENRAVRVVREYEYQGTYGRSV